MNKAIDHFVIKSFAFIFASLLTMVGWMIKTEITSMTVTLKEIKEDVAVLNRDSLLLNQKVDFKLKVMEKEIQDVFKKINSIHNTP